MTRACLVIGCSEYTDTRLLPLDTAARDADAVFNSLCVGEFASYDQSSSRKLVNPMLREVLDALAYLLLTSPSPDVFTFYFSGHGAVVGGSFYMCFRDTSSTQYSTTALSIGQLLGMLNEGTPRQANLIIDACQAGGVVFDIGQAINPEALRSHDCPSISLFASAAADQPAHEGDEGGYATRKLVDILDGLDPMDSSQPYLDLVAVGHRVSQTIETSPSKQAPVIWGLNLTGVSQFARNPNGDPSSFLSSHDVTTLASASVMGQKLTGRRDALWRLYLELSDDIDLVRVAQEIRLAASLLDPSRGEVSSFIIGLSQTLPVRAALSGDRFAVPQILACCATCLLEFANTDAEANAAIEDIAARFVRETEKQMAPLRSSLADGAYHLLSRHSGSSELAFLPIRLSMLLGYIGAVDVVKVLLDGSPISDREDAEALVDQIVEISGGSIACVADTQASYLTLFFASSIGRRLTASAEKIIRLSFSDFHQKKGRILKRDFSGADALYYILQMAIRSDKERSPYLARPTEMLGLLLLLSRRYHLENVVDRYLDAFDHQSTNIFVPERLVDYHQRSVEAGTNVCLTVGLENPSGFFTVSEFSAAYDRYCTSRLQLANEHASRIERIGAALSALVYGNRVCWHLLVSD